MIIFEKNMLKMKRLLLLFTVAVQVSVVTATELYDRLCAVPQIKKIEKLSDGRFTERYRILFEQPVDHKHPELGTFTEMFVLGHAGFDRPTMLITQGYGGEGGLRDGYREEISDRFNTNQIYVEHRFFGVSVPEPCDWSLMTGENAAADLHAIRQAFARIYPGKWIASGISKGGQHTMIYATYYPNDVDVYVPYVGPVCRKVEDGRHEKFLAAVGRQGERDTIISFQKELLSRRNVLVPMMEEFCREQKLQLNAGVDEIFDMCVLELSFSLWQWGTPVSSLPSQSSADSVLFRYLVKTSGPDYFQPVGSSAPFFAQAAAELGYYGYDVRPFKGLLSIKSAKGYMKKLVVPADAAKLKFSSRLNKDINRYLKNNDPKMIFIYGEIDPWSSVMPDLKYVEGKKNMRFYIKPRGSHRTRINNMPADVADEIWSLLSLWLDN